MRYKELKQESKWLLILLKRNILGFWGKGGKAKCHTNQ